MSALRVTELSGGVHGDPLKVPVSAAPVDGRANEAVVRMLAQSLGVSNASVKIVGGFASRTKLVEVRGVTKEMVLSFDAGA